MLINISRYFKILGMFQAIFPSVQRGLHVLYRVHIALMCFFFVGYVTVLICVYTQTQISGNFFVGMIFFFGAIFVFIGIVLQSNMILVIKERHDELILKNEHLSQTENVTIFALAYQAEIRDCETGAHLDRTAQYVGIISNELRKTRKYKEYITDAYMHDLVKSAPLHDIGKVGIPDAILKKPGKLTHDEFETMKRHCEYGASILQAAERRLQFQSFFNVAIKIVMSHHEKWDGSGYPHGLKGDEIPLSARIMALADVYDALRSHRCYKDAYSHEKSCNIIKQGAGTHFDPDVVEAFLQTEKEFLAVSSSMDQ